MGHLALREPGQADNQPTTDQRQPTLTVLPSRRSSALSSAQTEKSLPLVKRLTHCVKSADIMALLVEPPAPAASSGLETWAPVKEAAPVSKPQKNTGLSDKQIKKAEKAKKKAAKKAAKKAKKS